MTPDHINNSIARALKGESGLDADVLKIHGFSTPTMRRLFNNLCNVDGILYCECGLYCGASFIAAINNNPIRALGIEDFSQDFSRKGVRDEFYANLNKWRNSCERSIAIVEKDCFAVAEDLRVNNSLGFIDVLFYDAHHDFVPTSRALPAFFDLLADTFIYIVDDFNWDSVSGGTQIGFNALIGRFKPIQQWTLSGKRRQDDKIWHNGVSLFLCEKIK